MSSYTGNAERHWTAVHWGTDTQGQQSMHRPKFASKKALPPRPPRPVTAPMPPLCRMIQQHMSDSSSSTALSSDSRTPSSSGSQESETDDSGSESDEEQNVASEMSYGITDLDQLPDRCLRDRCLQPLHKLQQQSFMPCDKQDADAMAEPSGLVWQDSGFMTPFSPRLVGPRRGDSRQISTAATGVTSVQGRGTGPAACSTVVWCLICVFACSRHLQQYSPFLFPTYHCLHVNQGVIIAT